MEVDTEERCSGSQADSSLNQLQKEACPKNDDTLIADDTKQGLMATDTIIS